MQNFGLSSNQLTSLHAEIGQLSRLRQLYLSYNQLTALPAEIGQLPQL
ncbi:leucine-rich repeat domain-containing protein [Neochlamydia sp. EPS4]